MIRERVLAGLARAKEQGISLGRRRLEDCDAAKVMAIKRALAAKRGGAAGREGPEDWCRHPFAYQEGIGSVTLLPSVFLVEAWRASPIDRMAGFNT